MFKNFLIITLISLVSCCALADTINKPFPQAAFINYAPGTVKPIEPTQDQMNAAVLAQWTLWKSRYLKPAGPDLYVQYKPEGGTVSEAQGYGMILCVLMAGMHPTGDPDAKVYFDKLYAYYLKHPSKAHKPRGSRLMAWKQDGEFEDIEGANSATDGDMDIAYALLLADKQWGSQGSIDYRDVAIKMINEIMRYDVNQEYWTLKLGDWQGNDGWTDEEGIYHPDGTRSSDFLIDHMRVFKAVTGDARWQSVIDKTHDVIAQIHTVHSAVTGLMPDFIIRIQGIVYQPAEEHYLETQYDGYYYYNAARTPWRLATDYLVNGENTPGTASLETLNNWIKSTVTNNNPNQIKSGFHLNGNPIPGPNYASAAFIGPFGVSAMISLNHQIWVDQIWNFLSTTDYDQLYYQDSIRLLSMIIMSGNWWTPMMPDNTSK